MSDWLKKWTKHFLGERICGGPFQGMRYVSTSCGSTFLPKILCTYEAEIAEDVITLIRLCTSVIVDLGCAEGYYANGALKLNSMVSVIAFDSDSLARELCQRVAVRNGYGKRIRIQGHCGLDALRRVFEESKVDLVIVDIEGYETTLLDPVEIPALRAVNLVVELHSHGGEETLRNRFCKTHEIKSISPREPSWQDIRVPFFRFLARLNRRFETSCVWERPADLQSSWLIMKVSGECSHLP